jgi:hypothetical protein
LIEIFIEWPKLNPIHGHIAFLKLFIFGTNAKYWALRPFFALFRWIMTHHGSGRLKIHEEMTKKIMNHGPIEAFM